MIKPHVWVTGQGWPGDYDLPSEEDWKKWEESYRKYALHYAKVADSMKVAIYCIATEFRKPAVKRPQFWKDLIRDIRQIYSGKLTYAANWDNYENVMFWDQLDYIGIDGYWPMSASKTPTVSELNKEWNRKKQELKAFSQKWKKKILFTEYGFESRDYAADGHWKFKKDTLAVNHTAQANAYDALLGSLWKEDWWAGGFLWKWHLVQHRRYSGPNNKRYTPQEKPAEEVIKKWYQSDRLKK